MDIKPLKKLPKVSYKFDTKSTWLGFFIILIISFSFWLIAILSNSSLFEVKEVKCNIALEPSLKGLIDRYALGRQLFTVDIKAVYAQVFKAHPEYKEINILREFPSTLRIKIKLRRPFAQLKVGGFYCIDRQGFIISNMMVEPLGRLVTVEITELPFKFLRGSLIKDNRLDFAFYLMERIKKYPTLKNLPVTLINSVSLQSAYFVLNNTKIIVGIGEIERKLGILEHVLKEQLKNNISSAEYIDLRYQKVYLGIKR
jgi:cell division septal protein FtsQ